jgi:hypothetical protein
MSYARASSADSFNLCHFNIGAISATTNSKS